MKKENTHSTKMKFALMTIAGLMIVSAAAADDFTTEFTAFNGTVNSTGGLETTTDNIAGYEAAVYEFDTDSFKKPIDFIGNYSTTDSKVNITLNVNSSERHYAIYFYKDGYITYEAINSVDDSVCDYCTKDIYLTKKTGATSNITLEQFDELAAGDPVSVGVNITAESPIDQTDYTGYIPNSSEGGPNLTEFYQTDVGYTLKVLNQTGSKNNEEITSKTETGTVTIDFGGYKRLDYTSIDETGVYNITGETDPTVDPKVSEGDTDFDFEQVQYLSKINTIISSASNEYTRGPAEAEINLEDNLPANEADIAEEIEYVWLNSLEVGDSLINDVQGAEGLDAVDINDRNNYTVLDSDYLPFNQAENENGDWYLCHRAWVNDSRSFITKGKTSCRHFMIDDEEPQFSNFNGPSGQVTYSETGYNFEINVSDNIQLEKASLYFGLNERKEFTAFQDPAGENQIHYNTKVGEGSYTYEWRAWDKVMSEIGLSGANYTTDLTVNPLAPNLNIRLENTTTGSRVDEIYWDDMVELNVTTDTSFAPLGFGSNFTGWSSPSDGAKQGSYSTDVSIDDVGTFNFEARAGHDNENYTEETVSSTVKVKEIPTNADITLLDEKDNQINSAGLMENVTVRFDPQATQKNSKTPVKAVSNLTLSAWDEINENGVYETDIQMKEEGTFEFNMTAGDTGTNSEGFSNTSDSETLTVSSTNGGDETLEWNLTIQDQQIQKSEAFSYGLEVNYSGTASDLTWNVLNDNFTVSTGSSKENATITNSTSLEVREYEIPVEVYDSSGNYLTGGFNVTVKPDLYWNSEPSDQTIDEGERYSQDLSGNVGYVGNKTNLTWNITENEDLFKVDQGLVEDKSELDPGTYIIGLNVSDDTGREINTSYALTVDEEVNSGGGGGGGSSGGGGGGGFMVASVSQKQLNVSVTPETIAEGGSFKLFGTLTESEGDEEVNISVDGERRETVEVDDEGYYEAFLTAGSIGEKELTAKVEDLEATADYEVVERATAKLGYPNLVEVDERFTICSQNSRTAEVSLYREQQLLKTEEGERTCFNTTLSESGTFEYRLEITADGLTTEQNFTVGSARPTDSGTQEFDFKSSDESTAEEPEESGDSMFGGGNITGSFAKAASSTGGKVGISIVGGVIVTILALFAI